MDVTKLDLPIIRCEHPADQDEIVIVVASRIQIRNCELRGKVNFANILLKEPMDLSGSIFCEEARFKGICFQGDAGFDASIFKRYVTFKDAYFSKDTRFQGACFFAIANFGNAVFTGHTSFGSASFSELCTNFEKTSFQGDADFAQSRFSGTANFRRVSFGKAASFWRAGFSADANFQGAKFEGYASFQSAILSGNADFRSALFGEELNLEFAKFQGNAIFFGSCIVGNANFFRSQLKEINFEDAVLEGNAQFVEATLGSASFGGAHFLGQTSFQRSSFQEATSFHRSVFQGCAIFEGAQFLRGANFSEAIFREAAQFTESLFLAETSFGSSKFCGIASFSLSQFKAKIHFESAHFQEDGLFLGTEFIESSDFTGATFQKNFLLDAAKIHIMRLSDATVIGHISLHNAEFTRLEVRWLKLCDHLAYDGAAYLSLAKNFRNLEWFEDADDCYYDYRRMSQSSKTLVVRAGREIKINWSKLLDNLAWISCGYGVRPRYTVFLSCVLIILFALLFWAGNGILVEPLNGSGPSIGLQENLTFLDNLYFSAMVFTAKTQVKWWPVGIYRYLATVESVLGWLLLALFLVTLGRTMIR